MKRNFSVFAFLLAIVLVIGACSTNFEEDVVLEPGEAFSSAFADMREAREAASVLGAFVNDEVEAVQPFYAQQVIAPLMHMAPVDLGNAPTRSQFTLLLNSLTVGGQPNSAAMLVRPSVDVTVYNHDDFYYIESGISLAGLPFPVVNIGVDGQVVSAQVPLLYDRYFAIDVADVMEEMAPFLAADMMHYVVPYGVGRYARSMEIGNYINEALLEVMDIEAFLLGTLSIMLEYAEIDVLDNGYTLVIPAEDANAIVYSMINDLLDALEAIDLTSWGEFTQEDWEWALSDIREELNIMFTQDLMVSYALEGSVLTRIGIEGFLGDHGDEIRFLISYDNNSGDHVGDVIWIIEVEDPHPTWPMSMRIEYISTLDTTSGFARRDGVTITYANRWDEMTISYEWYLTRTEDNQFYAGIEYNFGIDYSYLSAYMFIQGAFAYGNDFFTVDMDRLGVSLNGNIEGIEADHEIVMSAFFRHETISASAMPAIDPANQLFAMDASEEELESVWQDIEGNIETLTNLLSFLGM